MYEMSDLVKVTDGITLEAGLSAYLREDEWNQELYSKCYDEIDNLTNRLTVGEHIKNDELWALVSIMYYLGTCINTVDEAGDAASDLLHLIDRLMPTEEDLNTYYKTL